MDTMHAQAFHIPEEGIDHAAVVSCSVQCSAAERLYDYVMRRRRDMWFLKFYNLCVV